MKKISIIVPIYNSEKYLEKCLESIVNQTIINELQIILINDGSTDNSESIIDRYVQKFPKSIIKINKSNGGQASARNKGLELANAEYIMFVDSDDYIEKNKLTELYEYTKNSNKDLVVFNYAEIKDNNKTIKKGLNIQTNNNIINYLLSNMSPWNKIIKTNVIKKNNIKFLENYIYEDLATMPLVVAYVNDVGYYDEAIYNYVIYDGSTMRQTYYNKKLESIYYVIEYLIKEFKNRKMYSKYNSELEYIVIDNLLYGATGRFLYYPNYDKSLDKIVQIMKNEFPNWKNNKYYKNKKMIYKLTCKIFYTKNKCIIKLYNAIRQCIK